MARKRHRVGAETLERAFARAVRTVPGWTNARTMVASTDAASATIRVTATGWSSSLYRRVLITEHRCPAPDHTLDDIDAIADAAAAQALGDRLAIHARRHALATAHGVPVEHRAALPADQVLIDRTTAALLVQRRIDPAAAVAWHRRSTRETGVEEAVDSIQVYRSTTTTCIALRPEDAMPTLIVSLDISRPGGPPALLGHDRLNLAVPIPDTLLAAATGRPLGALVETGIPTLDRRIVLSASVRVGTTTVIVLEQDSIAIRDAIATGPLL